VSEPTTKTISRGGARAGAGRKSADGNKALTERFSTRLTAQQLETLERIGGAVWLRSVLDQEAKKNPA
jgi:hypothetical protein